MESKEPSYNGYPLDHWVQVRNSDDEETRWKAVDAIRHLCAPNESMPLFLETLANDSYWRARSLAMNAICDLAYEDKYKSVVLAAIPTCIKALQDESREVRYEAVMVLKLIGNQATESLESLECIVRQEDTDAELARLAATAIQAIGSKPRKRGRR